MTPFDGPIRFAAVDLRVAEQPLVLEAEEKSAVERAWRATVAANPALWNGSSFLFDRVEARGSTLTARAHATDFATLLHVLRGGLAGRGLHHLFPVAAVTSRDHRLLVGRQSPTTANAGLSYPPSGSFDADDRFADRLDPIANMRREVMEEVGLVLDDCVADASWWAIPSGPGRLALVRRHRSRLDAATLATTIGVRDGELDRLRLVAFDDPLALEATVPYVPRLLALLAAQGGGETDRPTPPEGSP